MWIRSNPNPDANPKNTPKYWHELKPNSKWKVTVCGKVVPRYWDPPVEEVPRQVREMIAFGQLTQIHICQNCEKLGQHE